MDDRLRILVITPYPPRVAATHGGAKAIGEFLAHTTARHRVGLVYLRHAGEPDLEEGLRSKLEFATVLERASGPRGIGHMAGVLKRRMWMLRGRPLWASDVASRELERVLQSAVDDWGPHIIRFEPSVAAVFLPKLRRGHSRVVLVDQDPILMTARTPRGALRRIDDRIDRWAWRRFDRVTRASADAVVVFTERDRQAVSRAGGAGQLARIPIAVDALPALSPVGADDDAILFVGNLNHPANREAVRHAAREILPLLRQRRPSANLKVVGQLPDDSSLLESGDAVELAGLVDDVLPYLDQAAVVIAPLRTGGGMRVKVIEALFAGKAVVAYPTAVDGLAVQTGRELLLAETPGEFAASVATLLDDRTQRERLATAARRWSIENVSWDAVLDEYDRLYDELLPET
jgi:glycosyltransferase involved in cell wall biosynthesis